jgi:hypothetical protein
MPNNTLVFQDSPGRPASAQIRFCHRFSLSTGDIEINYMETLATLDVDLTDGFEIANISVDSKRAEANAAEQAHEVEAEFCKGDPPVPLAPSDIEDLRYPGAVVQICVRPTQESINKGLYMRSIDMFTWTRTDTITGASVEQVAIEGAGAASNGLTELYCPEDEDSNACYFRSPQDQLLPACCSSPNSCACYAGSHQTRRNPSWR